MLSISISKLIQLFIVSVYTIIYLTISCNQVKGDAESDQYDFLTEFYESTSGSMWVNNTNWLNNDDNITLCDWYGIVCAGKWVEKIELKENGLGGELPNQWERLPYLDSMDLSKNKYVFCTVLYYIILYYIILVY